MFNFLMTSRFRNATPMVAALLLMCASLFFTACRNDEEETVEENITTVEVHLTGPGFDKKFFYNDLDGDGGAAPTIDKIQMPPLTGSIKCHVHVYDRSKTPNVDITEEIETESNEHLFTYAISGAKFTIANLDKDRNGKPFGLTSVWQTDQPSTGTVNIKLYHEPTNKDNSAAPGGEVDFDVTFPVEIK